MADVFEEYLKTIDTVICKLQFLLSVASLLPSSLISDHESRLLYQFSTNITQCRRGLTVAFIQSLNQDIQKWMDEKVSVKKLDEDIRNGLDGCHKEKVMQMLCCLCDTENLKMIENEDCDKHLIKHDKEKVYLKGKDKIVPPFRFGVEDVATKMWFHKLAYPGQCLTNSHLDIIFYYLRKKGKYAKEPKVKFTTTDCLFFKTIHALYEKFIAQKKNLSLITAQHAIADYIRGRKMLCGSPWHLCDHVFFIIHMETESHWILGRLNIEERRVYMYNSLSTAMKDSAAIKACQPFAVLLPHFFALFDEFKKENKPVCLDPFEVVKVDGLPQQTSNDCGCFVASFAEYFIDMKPIPPIFDVEKHRDRLAVLFYKYARMKEVEFIDSEDEAPPKGPKKNLS
ncbi:hypothetical protein G4B88_004381 [Cannabis sativa]|uniref:Ubiquitin-like protease family profile domain-containing protein n=1 Tax=Cannabis sativa TaxID=3483 RepID=A0A7J6I1I5_CANSA|nr:hypothetical protein G4B88_004381 [Cannabis sativa]